MKRYLKISAVLFTGLIFCGLLIQSCSHKFLERPDDEILLSGFEKKGVWGISPESGFSLRRTKKHVTQGKYALKVKFPKWNLPSINTKKLTKSWGDYEHFGFDVFNPHNKEVNFRIRLDDANGRRTIIKRQLNPGMNKIRIDKSTIANKIDASLIQFVVLYIHEPRERYTLYFDNMHLKRSVISDAVLESSPNFSTEAKNSEQIEGDAIAPRKAKEVKLSEPPKKGEIKVALAKVKNVQKNPLLISTGIPFAPGQLTEIDQFALFDKDGSEIPIARKILARWPQDQSIRSVLIQFPYEINHLYEYIEFHWGKKKTTKDLVIQKPTWDFPEGYLVLPPEWLSQSQVIGEQVPMRETEYDKNAIRNFNVIIQRPKTGNLRIDGYYSSPHVYYQLYVRTGEPKFFLEGRKELLHYRENEIQHEGKFKGASFVATNVGRYTYIQAMVDDYLLTGDPRTLVVMGYMAEFLKNNFSADRAFYPRNSTRFWTERYIAFPFLGMISYYELTQDKKYLKIAEEYMENLYKTQLQWPNRGGFIHNLHSHDPSEGARPDEYGGSPFMTGVLLEAIIKYHKVTQSDMAADSIFRAVDWLINEGLTRDKDTFKYMTADKYAEAGGQPDLNMLVVHAFGYAYRLSGYEDEKYLFIGEKLFHRALKDAFLKRRKQFNQNYRSSGHFLAYIQDGLKNRKTAEQIRRSRREQESLDKSQGGVFISEEFEDTAWRFHPTQSAEVQADTKVVYENGKSLKVTAKHNRAEIVGVGLPIDNWSIDQFSQIIFAYRINNGVPFGLAVQTSFGDWVCIGGTPNYACSANLTPAPIQFINDGSWHEARFDIRGPVKALLPATRNLKGLQFFTNPSEKLERFWLDDFEIRIKHDKE